jgi:nicotinamide-nucleotide amidase
MGGGAPRIAALAIGDELLSGEVLDTNLRSTAEAFSGSGMVVSMHATVPDDIEAIVDELRSLARKSDLVIVTGGLGPTSDDLTTEAVAAACGVDLEFQPHIEEMLEGFFSGMGREMPEENLKQAYLPRGSREIPAAGGTAPGFMIELEGALVAVLPGVPREMESMLRSHVLPEAARRFPVGHVTRTRRVMTFGMGESDIAKLVSDRIGAGAVRYGFLVREGPIVVKLTASGPDEDAVQKTLLSEIEMVEERLGKLIYAMDDRPMEQVVGDLLRRMSLTICTAESLTAGMVSARLANVAGASDYLLGGVTAYGIREKEEVLGVPSSLLADGAVSEAVALAMARGARDLYGADIAVATTGVAGPGAGGESKPVGTAAIALVHGEQELSLERRLPGPRNMVRNIATMATMNMIRLHLED